MPDKIADLSVRPRRLSDDDFLDSLGARAFSRYSANPVATVRGMTAERGSVTAVALSGGARVGFVILGFSRLKRPFGPWPAPTIARVNAVAVKQEMHGRGVGKTLVAHAEELARAKEAVCMSLTTAETNVRAIRLFTSAGFLAVAAFAGAYAHGQRGIAMFKPLVLT